MADDRAPNLGQDVTIDFRCKTTGAVYSFSTLGGDLMDFQADPVTNVVTRNPISNNGRQRRRVERVAYKGSIEIGRINGDFEAMEIQQQQIYRTGGTPWKFTIQQLVNNQDGTGSQSRYVYTNCDVYISKGAKYKMGDDVTITLEFHADDMLQLS